MNVRTFLCLGGAALLAFPSSVEAQGLLRRLFGGGNRAKEPKAEKYDYANQLPRQLITPSANATEILWRNGDALSGELAGVKGEMIVWKTKLFQDPISLNRSAIERIDFKTSKGKVIAPYRVVMLGGNQLTGEIASVADGKLTLISTHAGTVVIAIDQITGIERQHGPGIVLGDARDTGKFAVTDSDNNIKAPVMFAPRGAMSSPAFNQKIEWTEELPESGLVDVILRSDVSPAFSLSATHDNMQFAVETWDDELVLTDGANFVSAGPVIKPEDRSVHIRFAWARAAGLAVLYGEDGEILAQLFPEKPEELPDNVADRIYFHNKSAGFTIERFRVEKWNGDSPPNLTNTPAAYVETRTEVIPGQLTGRNETAMQVRLEDGSIRDVPLADVRAVHWDREPEASSSEKALTEIWFQDGQRLQGELVTGDGLIVQTAFSTSPVKADLDGLRAIVLPQPETNVEERDPTTLDAIVFEEARLHGKIALTGAALPQFLVDGADSAAVPASKSKWSLERAVSKEEVEQGRANLLVHVATKETLPAQVASMAQEMLRLTSEYYEPVELSVSDVHAVQFGGEKQSDVSFGGSGWRALKDRGRFSVSGETVTLEPGTAIHHPHAIQGGEVVFTMNTERNSGNPSYRVRLFTKGKDHGDHEINYLIADYSGIYAGVERDYGSGQFQSGGEEVPTNNKPAEIRFKITEKEVQIFINGTAGATAKRTSKSNGTGIIIETASLWGNTVGTSTLSNFASGGKSFMTGTVPFSDEAKREALLLPRLRRDDPPKHVLLGKNGDLLRGEMEALASSSLRFRTGLESFNIPNDRLAAIVWLKPPIETPTEKEREETSTSNKESSTQWLDLINGGRLALHVDQWQEDGVVGTHPALGPCRIPITLIHRVRLKEPPQSSTHGLLSNWQVELTPDPVIPGNEAESSPLIGQTAADFSLPLTNDKTLALSNLKGKVVVLDFWATWCGPCVQSLPGLIETMSTFPEDDVAFVGINQGESKEQVEQFLDTRGLDMTVALDADQAVGAKYGVEGIPYSVVIDREGKIAFVKTGFTADSNDQIAEAVSKALE